MLIKGYENKGQRLCASMACWLSHGWMCVHTFAHKCDGKQLPYSWYFGSPDFPKATRIWVAITASKQRWRLGCETVKKRKQQNTRLHGETTHFTLLFGPKSDRRVLYSPCSCAEIITHALGRKHRRQRPQKNWVKIRKFSRTAQIKFARHSFNPAGRKKMKRDHTHREAQRGDNG